MLKHRFGQYLAFVGAIGIFIFIASVLARTNYDIWALIWGVGLFSLGLSMQIRPAASAPPPRGGGLLNFGKPKAPTKPQGPAPKPAAPPTATAAPAAAKPKAPAKPQGPLSALLGGSRKTAEPPPAAAPPPAPPPAAPPKPKGLSALFGARPKKK